MPNKNKLVSVIIVNWDGKEWLSKCLSTIAKQTYKNIEIIVVDNASTDDSVVFIEKNFPKVKIIKNKKNLGFSGGNNIGIKSSSGDFIILINTDTWVDNYFIKNLMDFYKNNNYDVVAPTEKRYYRDIDFNCNTTIDLFGNPAYFRPRYKKGKEFYLSGLCLFFNKNLYLETKGLDNDFFMYFEDVDWFWRLKLLNKKYAYSKDIYVYHTGAGSTGRGIRYNAFLWRNQNILQMLIKNYSLQMLILILPLYFIQNLIEILLFLLIFKPKISYSYIQGWIFNLMTIKKTLNKRKWVQEHRIVSDLDIIKNMYFGSGKYLLLKNYLNFNEK